MQYIFFIHIINLTLILCIIYNGIFGIFSLLIGNISDIIDAILSKENLSSNTPGIIERNENIKKLSRCLNGDRDLFEEFVTNDIKAIITPLTSLYIIYNPVKTINEKIILNEKNEYNSLLSLEKILQNFIVMKKDIIQTTTREI